MTPEPTCFVGFDVAKDTITLVDSRLPRPRTIANERAAIRACLKAYDSTCLAVCEPTGGHEALLLAECLRASIPCHRADTLKVKGFIASFGTRAKTDTVDAAMLARYGRDRWAALPRFAGQNDQRFQALVRRRIDLIAIRTAETNRAKAPGGRQMAASFKAMLAAVQRQIKAIEARIDAIIAGCQTLRRRAAICTAMFGIGPTTAASLLALMPELGSMTRRQTAALASLAPHPNDSGTIRKHRKMHGGRTDVRPILFMPALAAAAGKGEFAPFYKHLIANGKKPKLAICAVMRKIIVTLNARLRDDSIQQS